MQRDHNSDDYWKRTAEDFRKILQRSHERDKALYDRLRELRVHLKRIGIW